MPYNFRPKHYHCRWYKDDPKGVMQVDLDLTGGRRKPKPTMDETVLRLAHAEYAQQHHGQDYERIQERGGFSVLEVIRLLADHVERLGGVPTEPRKKGKQ